MAAFQWPRLWWGGAPQCINIWRLWVYIDLPSTYLDNINTYANTKQITVKSTESEGFGMYLHQYMTKTWTQKPRPGDVSMKEQLNDHLLEVWKMSFKACIPGVLHQWYWVTGVLFFHPSGFKQDHLENAGRLSLTLRTQEFHYLKRSTSKMHPLFPTKKNNGKSQSWSVYDFIHGNSRKCGASFV